MKGFDSAFDAVSDIAERALSLLVADATSLVTPSEIPVRFGGSWGPDLGFIAETKSLSTEEVIEIFLERTYHVFMIGFLPGFPYMGEVDDRIVVPRKRSPRTRVPKGSVGIAGTQTGIYPQDSPGGWQIIGRTDMEMFTPGSATPTALEPGDKVRFVQAT
jgi:inhibitor of KinA